MDEKYYEKLLNIKTTGEQKWDCNVAHCHPYQATSYAALETLFNEYDVEDYDDIVDFGCGKGRLIFYINHFFDANVMGVEMNSGFYSECLENRSTYLKNHKRNKGKIEFVCGFAQEYAIRLQDNKFYFFNPFSVQLFIKIIENILSSVYESKRKVDVILYYPSNDYIYYLENSTPFSLEKEIRLDKFFNKDNDERFLIYTLNE